MTAWLWAAPQSAEVYLDIPASLEAVSRQEAGGATKIAEDLDRYAAILEQTRPDVIVECGTWRGGSALWFANQGHDVVTIDIDTSLVSSATRQHERITFITGNSVDPVVTSTVLPLIAGRRVMVVLDSDHDPNHVRNEINLYAPLVTVGCYLVVEDGILRWMGPSAETYPGPLDAVELMLMHDERWRRDLDIETRHSVTLHPGGWWQRAR